MAGVSPRDNRAGFVNQSGQAPGGTRMEYYPFTFAPVLREAPWGGALLRQHCGKKAPASARLGESGELVQDARASSIVNAGALAGLSLTELLRRDPVGILGEAVHFRSQGRIPLAVRLLDARGDSPLWVCPPDRITGEEYGPERVAAWVILRADTGARVRRGLLPGATREEFRAAVASGEWAEQVNTFPAREDDVVFLSAGTVHALSGGVLAFEVAQNSGVTWEIGGPPGAAPKRGPTDRWLDGINFKTMGVNRCVPVKLQPLPARRSLLMKCERFTLELLHLKKRLVEKQDGQRFAVLTCISGHATLRHGGKEAQEVDLPTGSTVLLPARLAEVEIVPDRECKLLKVFTS